MIRIYNVIITLLPGMLPCMRRAMAMIIQKDATEYSLFKFVNYSTERG
jgi:hypothetical protein